MSLTMPNMSFHSQRELSADLQLQQKVQDHTAISNCCLTRSQVRGNGAVIPPISDCKYSSVEQKCYDHVKPIIQSIELKIASKFLRWSCKGTKWGGIWNSGKNSRYFCAGFLSRTIALQNSPVRFPQSGAKIRANWKFSLPTAQGSRMPLVRAVYHNLLRRVAERSNQGVTTGVTIPGRRITMRAPKSPNNVTSTSVQYICFRKTSASNMGAPNLFLASGAI